MKTIASCPKTNIALLQCYCNKQTLVLGTVIDFNHMITIYGKGHVRFAQLSERWNAVQ